MDDDKFQEFILKQFEKVFVELNELKSYIGELKDNLDSLTTKAIQNDEKRSIAKKLILMDCSVDEVAQITNLSIDEVKALEDEL